VDWLKRPPGCVHGCHIYLGFRMPHTCIDQVTITNTGLVFYKLEKMLLGLSETVPFVNWYIHMQGFAL
jgi:hypothetical protein